MNKLHLKWLELQLDHADHVKGRDLEGNGLAIEDAQDQTFEGNVRADLKKLQRIVIANGG